MEEETLTNAIDICRLLAKLSGRLTLAFVGGIREIYGLKLDQKDKTPQLQLKLPEEHQ